MGSGSPYREVVRITEDYFGPAAQRFINRLITNHFDKTPEKLTYADLPELGKWIQVTASMLTDNVSTLSELDQRLTRLSRRSNGSSARQVGSRLR